MIQRRSLARMRYIHFIVICVFLTGCFGVPFATQGVQPPLIYEEAELRRADKVVIFIPGALSSVNVFDATTFWEDAGYTRAFYRYPGLDDLPLDHRVTPEVAAANIAAFANAHPDKDIALVGYSTGGPIALLAAPQISKGRSIHVAAMSTAVEYGGGFPTALRGLQDIWRAVAATGSLSREVLWKEFWAGLLYGPAAMDDPAFADRLKRDVALGEKFFVELNPSIALAHTLALPTWELPDYLDLTDISVAFFVGLNDRVFTTADTQEFSRQLGGVTIYGYPEQGHLLFFTQPSVYRDMLAFAQDRPVIR